jgi:hypothetical protein
LGAGTLGVKAGQGILDYYNKPVSSVGTTGLPSSYVDNYGYGLSSGVPTDYYNNILDSQYGGSYGL